MSSPCPFCGRDHGGDSRRTTRAIVAALTAVLVITALRVFFA